MIRQTGEYRTEVRHEMRGGIGDIVIEHLYDEASELSGNARLFARLNIVSGNSIGLHAHEKEDEVFYILSGTAEIDDNGVKRILGAGDTVLTGHGGAHAVKNVGKDLLQILAVILPYRENRA